MLRSRRLGRCAALLGVIVIAVSGCAQQATFTSESEQGTSSDQSTSQPHVPISVPHGGLLAATNSGARHRWDGGEVAGHHAPLRQGRGQRLRQPACEVAITYPQEVVDVDGLLLGSLRTPGLPVTVVLAPDGRIATRHVGPLTADDIRQLIEDAEV